MLKRAMTFNPKTESLGSTVPISYMASMFVDAARAIAEMQRLLGDKIRVEVSTQPPGRKSYTTPGPRSRREHMTQRKSPTTSTSKPKSPVSAPGPPTELMSRIRDKALAGDQPLPGFESALDEKAAAAVAEQARQLTEELLKPAGDIGKAASDMERNSPLFRGTAASPQDELFPPQQESASKILYSKRPEQAAGWTQLPADLVDLYNRRDAGASEDDYREAQCALLPCEAELRAGGVDTARLYFWESAPVMEALRIGNARMHPRPHRHLRLVPHARPGQTVPRH
jgi:hypothetical protein